MVTKVKESDPRVRRTRQLLQQAFMVLVQEKGFQHISVQDIAERATVNRATFYAHYEDKYALLDDCIHESFVQFLTSKLPRDMTLRKSTLRLFIQATFDFLVQMHPPDCKQTERQFAPLIEAAVQQELSTVLLDFLKRLPLRTTPQRVPLETVATVISWAICGSAIQWSESDRMLPAGEMARQVQLVLTDGLLHSLQLSSLAE